MAGAFGEGHIPTNGARELVRIVKSGGLVIIVMRKEYLTYVAEYVDRLEPLFKLLENEGIWSRLADFNVENYSFNKTGRVFVFQKN